MKLNKRKFLMSLLVGGLILGLATPSIVKATELEEDKQNQMAETTTTRQARITDSSLAPADWAFKESSIPLHDAILKAYDIDFGGRGNIDSDDDGYISKSEAAAWNQDGFVIITGESITGTLDGIEYFSNPGLSRLQVYGTSIEGKIPEGVFSLSNVKALYLGINNLSGDLKTMDFTGMSSLEELTLAINQFHNLPNTSKLPSTLKILNISENPLNDDISSFDVSGLPGLKTINLGESNLSGELHESIYELPLIETVILNKNPDISGNLTVGFENNTSLKQVVIGGSGLVQGEMNIPSLTDYRYDDLSDMLLNADGTLCDGVTQADVDRARESANYWSEPTRSDWLNKVNTAQEIIYEMDAESKVGNLLTDDGTNLLPGVDQTAVTSAKEAVDKLSDGDLKIALKAEVEIAQNMINAIDKVTSIYEDDKVIQADINNAQALVELLPAGSLQLELQGKINEVQKRLDEKNFVVLKAFDVFTGDGTVSATIDAPVEKFSAIYVDGKLLPTSNYVVTSGSVVITLNEAYLKTLDNGSYNVEVEFASGAKVSTILTVAVPQILQPPVDPSKPILPEAPTSKPSTKPTVSGGATASGNTVNTGDNTNLMSLYAILGTSLLGLLAIVKRKKEANKR